MKRALAAVLLALVAAACSGSTDSDPATQKSAGPIKVRFTNPTGADVGTTGDYVLRGGGYDSPAEEIRTNNRASQRAPEFRQNPSVGFRCVTEP